MEKERDEYLDNTAVNVIWQRCQVHFLRNILSKAAKKNTEEFRTDIKVRYQLGKKNERRNILKIRNRKEILKLFKHFR